MKTQSYICAGALSYLSCTGQLLCENGFICFAIIYNLCRVGFSGSPECPMGVLKAVFLVCQKKTALDFLEALNTGVLNASVLFQGQIGPGFLEALNV